MRGPLLAIALAMTETGCSEKPPIPSPSIETPAEAPAITAVPLSTEVEGTRFAPRIESDRALAQRVMRCIVDKDKDKIFDDDKYEFIALFDLPPDMDTQAAVGKIRGKDHLNIEILELGQEGHQFIDEGPTGPDGAVDFVDMVGGLQLTAAFQAANPDKELGRTGTDGKQKNVKVKDIEPQKISAAHQAAYIAVLKELDRACAAHE